MPDAGESRLRSLATMARALGRSERLETIIEMSAEEAMRAVDAASISISRLEAGTGQVRTLINVGELGPTEERWPAAEFYSLQEFTKLRTVVESLGTWSAAVDDPHTDAREADLLRSLNKGSALGVPLIVDGTLWGELYATRRVGQTPFNGEEPAYFEALAAILSGAISRALHVKSLEEMAFRDSLTGLANRRAVDEAVARALSGMASHPNQQVWVALADANGLKAVNDSLGHAEGDRFLRLIARCLVKHFSQLPGSLVARVGGDEFCVVVVGHRQTAVLSVASAMVRATYELNIGGGVSCGVAAARTSMDMAPMSVTELFQKADQAQYQAKREGARHAVAAIRVPGTLTA
jgi:diguanylate cyclase (GGDEF)-like protein